MIDLYFPSVKKYKVLNEDWLYNSSKGGFIIA